MTDATSDESKMDKEKTPELSPTKRTVARLMGGAEKYSLREVSDKIGLPENALRRFWRAMGFPTITSRDTKLFTQEDIDMVVAHVDMMDRGKADSDTLNSLIRAQSYYADRMVLWQYEALVEEFQGRFGLGEVDARRAVLDDIGQYEDFLIRQMNYAWRRHMAALIRRSVTELSAQGNSGLGSYAVNANGNGLSTGELTEADFALQRAFGFVDLVAFTHTSGQLSPHALVDFIQTFEFTCRDVISMYGARVVKMVGDAVLYIADDLETGITVVDHVVKALDETPNMPDVRASLVWGGVVSRFGDVFGPKVNLASRLCSVAPVNGILVDHETAEALYQLRPSGFRIDPFETPELEGIGAINAAQVRVLD